MDVACDRDHLIVPALTPLGFCLIWWDESEEGPKWGLSESNMNNQPACKSQGEDGNALNCYPGEGNLRGKDTSGSPVAVAKTKYTQCPFPRRLPSHAGVRGDTLVV